MISQTSDVRNDDQSEERRLALVPLPLDLIMGLIEEDTITPARYCQQGLPKDAVFISSHFDVNTQCVWFVYSHPSFYRVGPGGVIPHLRVTLQQLDWPHIHKPPPTTITAVTDAAAEGESYGNV